MIPGTLPLSAISLKGTAVTPMPAIALNFRTFSTGCADPTTCGVELADTGLQQGQGMHGSFSRADTRNIMGAAGPSFRQGFEDSAPASNADLGMTIAKLLDLKIAAKGKLMGRVLSEAMPNGAMPNSRRDVNASAPDANGNVTMVVMQTVGDTVYYDTAGYPAGRSGCRTRRPCLRTKGRRRERSVAIQGGGNTSCRPGLPRRCASRSDG